MEMDACLVTGGRGFVGRHLVQKLLDTGRIVRILDLTPELSVSEEEFVSPLGKALVSGKASYISADVRNRAQIFEAMEGVDVVFHMASPSSACKDYKLHYSVNVIGTRNIIDACLQHQVKKLIYQSSPDVVFDGVSDMMDCDESLPYPDKYVDCCAETKAQAEALVLNANRKGILMTCAIRASGVFGPGDHYMIPSLVEAAKRGVFKFVIGDGNNMFDWTYVENVVYAYICAEQALCPETFRGENVASGKAYFITNGEPQRLWDFLFQILEGLGYPRGTHHIPTSLALFLAYLAEWSSKIFKLGEVCTPSQVRVASLWRTFNITNAERQLGYAPIVELQDGIGRTIELYSNLKAINDLHSHKKSHLLSSTSSKSRALFGGGKVADLILWKDVKKSLVAVVGVCCMYNLFCRSGYTLISAVTRLMLAMLLIVIIYARFPGALMGYDLQRVFRTRFEISEESARRSVGMLMNGWNYCARTIVKSVREREWLTFVKVLICLELMSFLGRYDVQSLIGIGIPIVFTLPYLYQVKEKEIDGFFKFVEIIIIRYKTSILSKLVTKPKVIAID